MRASPYLLLGEEFLYDSPPKIGVSGIRGNLELFHSARTIE
jgi:hypothetical protein